MQKTPKGMEIVAIDKKTGREFEKEKIEELLFIRTGFMFSLEIREKNEI